jgi:hypothetical protein
METVKKITNKRAYFDKEGNLYVPDDVKFGGELSPSLNPKEWWTLLLITADKSQISPERQEKLFSNLVGSASNIYKVKRSLRAKGYLK